MPKEQAPPQITDQSEQTPVENQIEKKIDVGKALKMRLRGDTYREIAAVMGCTYQNIEQRLRPFTKLLEDPESVRAFREHEGDMLDSIRMTLAKNIIAKADDEKASVNNLAYAFTQIHNATRLIRGESTSNISQLTAIIQAASGSKHDATTKKE